MFKLLCKHGFYVMSNSIDCANWILVDLRVDNNKTLSNLGKSVVFRVV
jgi:hypothetical protein